MVTEALTQNRQTKQQRQLELEATVRRAAGYSAGVFPGAEMIKNSLQNDPSSSRAGETSTSGLPAQPLATPSRRGSLPPVESSPSHKLRERTVTFSTAPSIDPEKLLRQHPKQPKGIPQKRYRGPGSDTPPPGKQKIDSPLEVVPFNIEVAVAFSTRSSRRRSAAGQVKANEDHV
jgi:hypothetical protein